MNRFNDYMYDEQVHTMVESLCFLCACTERGGVLWRLADVKYFTAFKDSKTICCAHRARSNIGNLCRKDWYTRVPEGMSDYDVIGVIIKSLPTSLFKRAMNRKKNRAAKLARLRRRGGKSISVRVMLSDTDIEAAKSLCSVDDSTVVQVVTDLCQSFIGRYLDGQIDKDSHSLMDITIPCALKSCENTVTIPASEAGKPHLCESCGEF